MKEVRTKLDIYIATGEDNDAKAKEESYNLIANALEMLGVSYQIYEQEVTVIED